MKVHLPCILQVPNARNMKKNKQKYNKDKMIVMGKKTAEKAERDYIYDHYEMIRRRR